MSKRVFVFGSNASGIHGLGAAKFAYEKKGAQWGKSYGHIGDSFAIPTKDRDIQTLSIHVIHYLVMGFLAYAYTHPKLTFQVSAIGCGLAGYKHSEIARLFQGAPLNCMFQKEWETYLGSDYTYWEFEG